MNHAWFIYFFIPNKTEIYVLKYKFILLIFSHSEYLLVLLMMIWLFFTCIFLTSDSVCLLTDSKSARGNSFLYTLMSELYICNTNLMLLQFHSFLNSNLIIDLKKNGSRSIAPLLNVDMNGLLLGKQLTWKFLVVNNFFSFLFLTLLSNEFSVYNTGGVT